MTSQVELEKIVMRVDKINIAQETLEEIIIRVEGLLLSLVKLRENKSGYINHFTGIN